MHSSRFTKHFTKKHLCTISPSALINVSSHLILISVLTRLPRNLRSLKLLSTPVCVLNGSASLQVLELDGSLGSTTSLLHDGEVQDLVGLAVEFNSQPILDIGGVYGDGERGGWSIDGVDWCEGQR